MKISQTIVTFIVSISLSSPALAQSKHEAALCEAAKTNQSIEMVYDKDASKGCLPRLIDVHQVAIGNNGQMYMHGWQKRGCTKGRDYASERIFRFDKIKSVKIVEGEFSEKSQSIKAEGWDGCIGSNCFIKENICE
ncbi:WYL domain-containing protein [Ahrensia kielensis]|uniref:WYL domain-containing protein n=1 Tax=Ahrensia kielensis TaxID=76980 RepID=A0ABU9TAI4_9HYPH